MNIKTKEIYDRLITTNEIVSDGKNLITYSSNVMSD